MAYSPTVAPDGATTSAAGGPVTQATFHVISAMPCYATKSFEELRWEDYQQGCRGGSGQVASSPQGAVGGMFGAKPAMVGAFGAPAASPFGGGAAGGFGGGTGAVGGFGGFGGSPQGGAATPFGAVQTPAFGAVQTPAFGQQGSGGFGAPKPAFGGTPGAFGATTPAFGAPQAQPAFGQQAAAPSAFGAQPGGAFGGGGAFGAKPATPAFGAQPFGQQPAAAGGLFGAATQPGASAFGGGGLFGAAAPAAAPSYSFGALGATQQQLQTTPQTSLFGAAPAAAGGGLFGSAGGGLGMGMFGAAPATTPAAGGGLFGGGGSLFGGASSTPFGASSMQAPQQAQLMALPTVSDDPYGKRPPRRSDQVGMDAPFDAAVASQQPQLRRGLASPLFLAPPPRAAHAPRSAAAVLAARRRGMGQPQGGASSPAASPLNFSASPALMGLQSHALMATPGSLSGLASTLSHGLGGPASGAPASEGGAGGSVFPAGSPLLDAFSARENPRALFIREECLAQATEELRGGGGGGGGSPAHEDGAAAADGAPAAPRGLFASPQPQAQRSPASPDGTSTYQNQRQLSRLGAEARAAASDANGDHAPSLLPKLTLPNHTMHPDIATLARMPAASLAAVDDFTVSLTGVAQIRWLGSVDVRGLDLDSIIHFTPRTVSVYHDDSSPKPARGVALNRAAEVTFFNIFKLDKRSGEPVTQPADVAAFKRKLMRAVGAQDGARFVSYDGESGEWRFTVQHFSRYGLLEDSDDDVHHPADSDSEGTPLGLVRRATPVQPAVGSALAAEAGAEEMEVVEVFAERIFTPTLPPPMPSPVAKAARLSSKVSAAGVGAARAAVSPLTAPEVQVVQAPPPQPARYEPLACAPQRSCRGAEGAFTDASLFLGRSFRVGWSPDGRLFRPSSSGVGVTVTRLPLSPASDARAMAMVAAMRVHLEHSGAVEGEEEAEEEGQAGRSSPHEPPAWSLRCERTRFRALCNAFAAAPEPWLPQLVAEAAVESPACARRVAAAAGAQARCWQLLSLLHAEDPCSREAQEDARLEGFSRRAGVVQWLREAAADAAALSAPPPRPGAAAGAAAQAEPDAAALLVAGRAADACALLVACGDPRHATLAAQSGCGGALASLLARQLAQHGTAHVAPRRALLLRLLAGEAAAGGRELTPDWRRALLAQLRLGGAPSQPLCAALDRYEAAVAAGGAPPPVPPHRDGGAHPAPGDGTSATDVCYVALRSACCDPTGELHAAVPPQLLASASSSPQVLHALPGWHLGAALLALCAPAERAAGAAAVNRAAVDAAAQLSLTPALVPWALLACLTVSPPQLARALAWDLLARRWPDVAAAPGGRAFLRSAAMVPDAWLDAAESLWRVHSTHRAASAGGAAPVVGAPTGVVAALADPVGMHVEGYGAYEPPLMHLARHRRAGLGQMDVCAQLDGILTA